LLDRVLSETIDVVGADGGAIYLLDEGQRSLTPEVVRWIEGGAFQEERGMPPIQVGEHGVFAHIAGAARSRTIVVADQPLDEAELASLGLRRLAAAFDGAQVALVVVPLLDRNQEPFAILTLAKALQRQAPRWNVDDRLLALIHAISGTASVALHN